MAFQEPCLTASTKTNTLNLRTTTIEQLISAKPTLVWDKTTTSVAQVLQKLHEHQLVSLPIYSTEREEFIGVVHIFAIVTALFPPRTRPSAEDVHKIAASLHSLTIGELLFKNVTVCLECVNHDCTLESIVEPLSRVPHHLLVHVPNLADQQKERFEEEYKLISQLDIIRFVVHHEFELDEATRDKLLSSLEDLGLVQDRTVARFCTDNECGTVLTALHHMKEREITALAICKKTGELLYNFSASDLKGLTADKLGLLLLPVDQFLREGCGRMLIFPVTCPPSLHLKDLLENLLAARAHRVYVIDENQRPLAVISFTDILHILLQQ